MAKNKAGLHSVGDIPEEERAHVLDLPENQDDMHVDPEAPPEAAGGLEAAATKWRVAEALNKLLAQVNKLAPNRSKASDGSIGDAAHATRASDHNPWVSDGSHGVVTARDFTHDPEKGCDCDELAEMLRASRDPRIKYIIWKRRICASAPKGGQPAWAWRPYSGSNPHTKHLHLSVLPTKALYDSEVDWAIGSAAALAPAPRPQTAPVNVSTNRDAEMAALDQEAQALIGLVPLLHRLTALQDSDDPAIEARAAGLLARYQALNSTDLASQPRPEADAALAVAAVKPSPPHPLPPFKSTSFADLKDRYEALYAGMVVRPEWASQVAWHRKKLLQYRPRYEAVAAATAVPWWFIGIVHALEGSFNFATHLHNGDPLTARTVRHPPNRPAVWNPPNDWESSAIDALTHDKVAHQTDWKLARTLHRFESYNGMSYYKHGINSPYLWSFSNQYEKGKFIADHVYSADAVSKQCGAVVMLHALVKGGDVTV